MGNKFNKHTTLFFIPVTGGLFGEGGCFRNGVHGNEYTSMTDSCQGAGEKVRTCKRLEDGAWFEE